MSKHFDIDPTIQDFGRGHYDYGEVFDLAVAEIRKLFPDATITRETYLHRMCDGIIRVIRGDEQDGEDIEREIGEQICSLQWINNEPDWDGE